jgi:hypothetical protein
MDWSRVGRAVVQMDVDSLRLAFDVWPNFDRRYYRVRATRWARKASGAC